MDLQQWYSTLPRHKKGEVKEELAVVTNSSIHTARSYLTGTRPIPFRYALDICSLSNEKVDLKDLALKEKERGLTCKGAES
ncbi:MULTISPECIES: hypothetical protein [Pseudoalteromonas]|uniref:hypothetical protein n=1 Tax=Pseudoalteromonas TaxID=53246 RepID=UPI00029B42E0|nr:MULTISPECIES: hypothetical protein [Pseudoalteromonas]MDW7548177.1 hypothetical protein [Pseudoalteromonas peptidolytica]